MKKLSKQMIEVLKKGYEANSLEGINKSTLKALFDRGYIDQSGKLSGDAINYVISELTIEKQCHEINIDFEIIDLNYKSNPEKDLLKYFNDKGYVGCYYEGISIFTILKALLLNELSKHNYFGSRDDACSRYLEAQLVMLKDKSTEVIQSISKTDKQTFLNNFTEIINNKFISIRYPDLSVSFADALFEAIDSSIFINLANKINEDPYKFRSGWPDLTIVKNEDVQFIEVKTIDKLHLSQLYTIPVMREILPFKFRVVKLRKI